MMPDTFAHYAVIDDRPDLTPAEHIDRAGKKWHRAGDCDRHGMRVSLLREAADHLRSALRAIDEELEEWR